MATATKTAKTEAKPATKAGKPKDATALLRADHQAVADLFEQYEKTRSPAKKGKLVADICQELTVHAQVEEEIFYPAFKQALKDKELVPEATVEHDTLKSLISQIDGVGPDGEMFDAKVLPRIGPPAYSGQVTEKTHLGRIIRWSTKGFD